MAETKLIVGLGNPGKDYEYTRHNLGFLVVRRLAERWQFNFGLSSFSNGLTAQGKGHQSEVVLLMPLTYMNQSGVALKQVQKKLDLSNQNMIVVCDDLNLDFGQLRMRKKGTDGGHNGLASITEKLNSDQFPRLRMGIGSPKSGEDAVDYVLEEFNKKEKTRLNAFIDQAADSCQVWMEEGIEKAMDQFNRRKNNE